MTKAAHTLGVGLLPIAGRDGAGYGSADQRLAETLLFSKKQIPACHRALYFQTFELQKRILGQDHPATRGTMKYLALNYSKQGRYQEAQALQISMIT